MAGVVASNKAPIATLSTERRVTRPVVSMGLPLEASSRNQGFVGICHLSGSSESRRIM
jgi:hypothetical protein